LRVRARPLTSKKAARFPSPLRWDLDCPPCQGVLFWVVYDPSPEPLMRFTGTARFSWLIACVGIFVATHGRAFAIPPDSPVAKREAQKMRAVLEENFQAINEEDLKKLLGTASCYTGTQQEMAEFAAEAKQMFKDTDVYMRLVEFELVRFQPPMAEAVVKQLTLPPHEKDSLPATPGKLYFRNHSALLPESQLVKYRQLFRFEGGKWKVHRIISTPEPVTEWSDSVASKQR
jgi:hypothetical protein